MDTVVIRSRYCSSVTTTAYLTEDGTRKSGMPPGLAKKIDFTKKTITITGTPTEPGTYSLLINLSGIGSEKVADTLTICVAEGETFAKGDVNRDGAVDVADIATVINFMADNSDLPTALCDVNGDGAVDVADIASIINIMATEP